MNEVAAEAPLEITTAQVNPMPAADDVQFAAVSVTVTNRDAPIDGVRVLLNVQRDGEAVEDFVLASSVTLQPGETVIEQRYIPLEGWTPGEWTFAVTLESQNPQTSAEATLATVPVEAPITVAGKGWRANRNSPATPCLSAPFRRCSSRDSFAVTPGAPDSCPSTTLPTS
ncbi:MAG TPA: hypothetical protein VKZ61_06795 [Thermomicrobiales bacterium]|nr:hypothetical protein [Thermomicrobiales bacterium]